MNLIRLNSVVFVIISVRFKGELQRGFYCFFLLLLFLSNSVKIRLENKVGFLIQKYSCKTIKRKDIK